MSVSKWRWTEACDGLPCPGDCDLCGYEFYLDEGTYVPDCEDKSSGDMIKPQGATFGGDNMASTPAVARANEEYKRKTYDSIRIRVPKGYRDSVLRAAADAEDMSINEYVLSTVAKRIAEEHPEIHGADEWKVSLLKSKNGGQ